MTLRTASFIVLAASLLAAPGYAQEASEQAGEQAEAAAQPLMLRCRGGGISAYGNAGRASYDAFVEIELFTGKIDRIRLPNGMVPPLLRTDSGWYRIKDSNANAKVINAITSINMFNTPQIRIDRVAGTMEITAVTGSFAGECEKIDRAAEAPKF